VRRVTGAAVAGALSLLIGAPPALADGRAEIVLPTPGAALAQDTAALCAAVGCTADRLKASKVPGPVVNDELVLVGLDGGGTPRRVQLEQRLLLTGVGDYVIRERGPARAATPLVADSDPPNTKLGAVVWQGFTPGDRRLGARLTLDAGLEAGRLPLAVTVSFAPSGGGAARPLAPGGQVPSAGTVTVRLTNRTAQPAVLPTAADAAAAVLAPALDAALRAARTAPGPRLPSTDSVLPRTLPVTGPARVAGSAAVPLRVTGTLRLTGTTGAVTGPGTTALADGAAVAGTLSGSVEFTATVTGAGRLTLSLTAVPALDPRPLAPPNGAATWAAWARSGPPAAERKAALDLLVATAATGARAASYSPYLGADLPGTGSTRFDYAFAPAERVTTAAKAMQARPGAIALAALAGLLLLVNSALLWRRS
jgi:hypothetical protein